MVHATDVLERLAKDVKIVVKNISLSPTENLHSILGDAADWKSEPGSLSEVAHFSELIAERRAALRFSEFGRLKREQLTRQREIAVRERAVGRIVSILHARHEGPIPLEPELALELEALAEAHTHLEAVSERLAAGRPADRKS